MPYSHQVLRHERSPLTGSLFGCSLLWFRINTPKQLASTLASVELSTSVDRGFGHISSRRDTEASALVERVVDTAVVGGPEVSSEVAPLAIIFVFASVVY